MHGFIRRLVQLRSERAFTLVEVLVAGLVMVIGFIFIAQFFTSAAARILTSDTRSLMQQVANQEIETIRALQYQDVGTVDGNPAGALATVSDPVVVEGRSFRIEREVTYIKDLSYSGAFPANYRRATVKVYLNTEDGISSAVDAVEMSTNVAGGAEGGTLDITVSGLSGAGVEGAQLTVTDDVLVPRVLINASAIRTDNSGKIMIPGLTPDPGGGYQVQATKSGYNAATLKQTVVVVNGTPSTVIQLIIDRLATMNIHVTNQNGVPLSGVALSVTGYQSVSPWTFSQTVGTDANGVAVLPNIRYSTSLEPYFIQLVTAQNPPLRLPTGVTSPTIDASFLPLPAGKIPVLLDPGTTQDVYVVVDSGPAVTAVSPNSGPAAGGTSVTISGFNFTGAAAVKFGSTNATSFTVVSATSITAIAPAGTGVVDITVTTPSGTSATSSADRYTYVVPAPTVTGRSPTGGPAAGGTSVTITGTNFTGATAVRFGGTNATSFTVVSATSITAIAPAGTGAVDITVTTPGGTSATSSADLYTYVTPPPTVIAVSPIRGPTAGGTSVTITGTDFTGATAVKFGTTNATSFTVVSATQITAVAPAGTGTKDVRVTTPSGTSAISTADQYTYVARPTVTARSPTSGPAAGGTTVTITGTNFTWATAVMFGTNNATSFTVLSATSIRATAPAGTGLVNITVTSSGGTSATGNNNRYQYN